MTGKDDKYLPYNLENMSIPELEALLQQDFLASDGSSPDVDYIMAIVEVIHKKEQAQPDYQPLDTAKAWEDFQSFYIQEENSVDRSDQEAEENFFCSEPQKQSPKHKKSKMLHRLFLAAASICLLVALTCIPVFGYHNFVQMLASWTAEQFRFYLPPAENAGSDQVPEELEELQEIMQQLGAELVVPKFPEGFEPSDSRLSYLPDDNTLKFSIMYQQENDYYIFGVYWNGNQILSHHEKGSSLVEKKVYSGIEHHYFENNGNSAVAWSVGTIEYYIVTNMSTSVLKETLESMYNE